MRHVALALAAFGLSAAAAATDDALAPRSPASRTVEFTYTVRIKEAPAGAKTLRLWIPMPVSDERQRVSDLTVSSPVPHEVREEPEYGNRYAYLTLEAERLRAPQQIALNFQVTRHEHRVRLERAPAPAEVSKAPAELKRALEPDRLVPLDGLIGDLSREKTKGRGTALEKGRAVYDFVLSAMRYDKSGEGWGRGDAIYACNVRKGNCTDFHALFIGMMRAAGVPARFEIGFSLPRDRSAGDIGGYHCWAQFWADGLGWIPVDASEAWKDPSRRDYFFGAHDAHRILFTRGRDIRLDPAQKGRPLNYFIYPHAELDGKPWAEGVQTIFSFRDIGKI